MAVSYAEAAKYLCKLSDWRLTHLQLHKMLYIAHMAFLGQTGEPLISDERFEAWDYGPVLPSLYRHLRPFGSSPVSNVFKFVPDIQEGDEKDMLDWAYQRLAKVPAATLVALTHRENGAWWNFYRPQVRNITIPDNAIMEEYKNRIQRSPPSRRRSNGQPAE